MGPPFAIEPKAAIHRAAIRQSASDPKRTVGRIKLEQATAALLRVAIKITGEM
jgi:hypothetical protein